MICIYSITNKINKKVYVGQTDNYARRYYQHILKLSTGRSPIKLLQEDFNKYGESNFEFKVEQECALEELDKLEQFYINKLNAFEDNGGYNANTGGKSGYVISQRVKQEQSKIIKENFKNNPEYYNKIVQHGKEIMANPEFRQKTIETHRIRMADPECRKQLSESCTKAFNTPEIKENRKRITTERYKDPEERKKTAEATKAAMANLPKEKLSRKHLCKTPIEVLMQMTKETNLKQKELAEKFNVPLSLAKGIKSGKHWIYEYIEENN